VSVPPPHVAALGIDAGSTTTKMVGVDRQGEMVWDYLEATDPRMEEQVARLLDLARREAGARGAPLVATGYGRNLVRQADRKITEITCHAKGVYRSTGHGGTLVDIGGQDSKVIVIDESGNVVNFTMNDKCAAGTGRFLEVVAGRLQLSLAELSFQGLSTQEEVPISSTCTVFAESEMISLLARGQALQPIVRGLYRSLVRRIAAMAKSAGLRPPLMLSGGVAKSHAMQVLLGEELGAELRVPDEPQLMGAYGAALAALNGAK
jgi:predicted CoA-substrate-specific enzyme activase